MTSNGETGNDDVVDLTIIQMTNSLSVEHLALTATIANVGLLDFSYISCIRVPHYPTDTSVNTSCAPRTPALRVKYVESRNSGHTQTYVTQLPINQQVRQVDFHFTIGVMSSVRSTQIFFESKFTKMVLKRVTIL